jgi:hypothetical protein
MWARSNIFETVLGHQKKKKLLKNENENFLGII